VTRTAIVAYALIGAASLAACHKSPPPETSAAPAPSAAPAAAPEAPPAPPAPANTEAGSRQGGPESSASLTQMLTTQTGITPEQANGAVGAILSFAQSKLPPADFEKVAATIPGGADLAKAAGPIGDKKGLIEAFNKQGISPYLRNQVIPTVNQYVAQVGGPQTGQLLTNVITGVPD
jgi:hypothetical protein